MSLGCSGTLGSTPKGWSIATPALPGVGVSDEAVPVGPAGGDPPPTAAAPPHGFDTALIEAVLHGSAADAEAALLHGDDPDAQDENGVPVLHLAAARGAIGTVVHLVRHGATVDLPNETSSRRTALHTATLLNNQDVVTYLILSGADVNAVDDSGMTSMHVAAQHGFRPLCFYLLGKGADPALRDSTGQTPADYMTSSRHPRQLNRNIAGCCVSDPDMRALYELHAGEKGYVATADFLALWESLDPMGAPPPKALLPPSCKERVAYHDFCIQLLRLARM